MAIKITLRKCNAIQGVINNLLRGVEVKTTVSLNEFEDVSTKLTEANNTAMAADARRSDLLMALYSIRTQVGVANAQSGIVAKLTHAAFIDKRLAQLDSMSKDDNVMLRPEVINGKLDKIRNRKDESHRSIYGREDEVHTGLMTTEQVENVRKVVAELRKQKQALNDEILELNVRTEVELTPEVEAVLVNEGII
jgi:hypothetical protein